MAVIGITLAVMAAEARAADDPLVRYRGTSRVLVLSAENSRDTQLVTQHQALAAQRRGVSERDLAVVEAVGSDETARALRRRLHLPETGFHAVLVGKDGSTKLTSTEPIPLRTLFSTIDAMPMRRQEMRER